MVDLGDVHIHQAEKVSSVGVVVDSTLSFDAHVNSVCKATNYHAEALRRMRKRVTTNVTLSIATTTAGA